MANGARRVWWSQYKTTEFERLDPMRVIAVLPIAAVEQHGPHLPTGTDQMINEGMLETMAGLAPEDLDLRILPVQAVGKSNEHLHAPGTLTLPPNVLIEAWTELGLSVARAGVRKLVIVNSHGGNEEIMGIVARELRVRAKMLVVKTAWSRFGHPAGMIDPAETRYGIHGGEVETSLMLHFRPDTVAMEKAETFVSSAVRDETEFDLLRPTGIHAYAWIASDLNPKGTVGDASKGTAEKGRRIAEHAASGFVRLLQDVRKSSLPA
ncbi:creatininase family protein [Mangrovibrevibacter kandeliae]|uniref:creatininase family protein n=1 Tax=Mangrovibrevibacter kandeliae TaxID=2968473 RepID=UPI0021172FC2|nr:MULTISPECIES: creatininase family protein [unclassified Aurantimonas]MCQ8784022.1 creatininase family protein [Aurantimonas sp. CSK15Z-1]MCW4116739.1 creatininase family protein [Aurantimonas sp. MSK8Z-1]